LIESQIAEARKRALQFSKSLERARQQEEIAFKNLEEDHGKDYRVRAAASTGRQKPSLQHSEEETTYTSASEESEEVRKTIMYLEARVADLQEQLSSKDSSTSHAFMTRNGELAQALEAEARMAERIAALERQVKGLQQDIISANTELRVAQARNTALEQKLAQRMSISGESSASAQLEAADAFVQGLRTRLEDAENANKKATSYAQTLEQRLEQSDLRCQELIRLSKHAASWSVANEQQSGEQYWRQQSTTDSRSSRSSTGINEEETSRFHTTATATSSVLDMDGTAFLPPAPPTFSVEPKSRQTGNRQSVEIKNASRTGWAVAQFGLRASSASEGAIKKKVATSGSGRAKHIMTKGTTATSSSSSSSAAARTTTPSTTKASKVAGGTGGGGGGAAAAATTASEAIISALGGATAGVRRSIKVCV